MTNRTKAALAFYDQLIEQDPIMKNAISTAAQKAGIATATLSIALKRRNGSPTPAAEPSRTQKALMAYDRQEVKSIKDAAAEAKIEASTLSLALKRRRELEAAGREVCPCCHQVLRAGFQIDRSVLR